MILGSIEIGLVRVHIGRGRSSDGQVAHMTGSYCRVSQPFERQYYGGQLPCADGMADAGGYAAKSLWASYVVSGAWPGCCTRRAGLSCGWPFKYQLFPLICNQEPVDPGGQRFSTGCLRLAAPISCLSRFRRDTCGNVTD